jgi:2-polyprenyl-3-methyl-5-hydroxy-6-metoxy-1,4-benzoquinol methylase
MIWRCPRCRARLREERDGLRCVSCASSYECIGGIPDLRIPGASWIDQEADRATARRLIAETEGQSLEQVVRHVYRCRPEWDEARISLRTRQFMAGPSRLRKDVSGWLQPATTGAGPFLDLGCGQGVLLAAAAAEGRQGIGVDASLVWLVVAQRLIAEWGGKPVLAAAMAEALPLEDGAVSSVISLDVIEHVAEPGSYLTEIDRVTAPGGQVFLSTPNRYSLAAEPHVSVWGVGWLPRRLQKGYVKWRSGKSYDYVRLISASEAARLVHQHSQFLCEIRVPLMPEEEIAHFPAYRARLARLYNRLARLPQTHSVMRRIGPFFRIIGTKAHATAAGGSTVQ